CGSHTDSEVMFRVLVVDDNPHVTTTLAGVLRAWGHDVRTANGGLTAVSLAALYHPEVVLLDVAMPGISGIEVARRLRSNPSSEAALLVAVTGLGEDLFRQLDSAADFDLLLPKPVCFDELKRILGERNAPIASAV